eukprot:PhF_6_TR608/c5_g1_i3/m.763/K03259/EIF4E; translation initiation factor 4E
MTSRVYNPTAKEFVPRFGGGAKAPPTAPKAAETVAASPPTNTNGATTPAVIKKDISPPPKDASSSPSTNTATPGVGGGGGGGREVVGSFHTPHAKAPSEETQSTTTSSLLATSQPHKSPSLNPNAKTFTPTQFFPPQTSATTPAAAPTPSPIPAAPKSPRQLVAADEEDEDAEASSQSKSLSRFSFNPMARTFKPTGNVIPPMDLPPAVIPTPTHKLHTAWVLYTIIQAADGSFAPVPQRTMRNVEEFWSVFNHVRVTMAHEDNHLSKLAMYLFREGIEPKWEDPKNVNGGYWQMTMPVTEAYMYAVDEHFRSLCCWAVSEPALVLPSTDINGLGIRVREKAYSIQIWTGTVPAKGVDGKDEKAFVELVRDAAKEIGYKARADFFVNAGKGGTGGYTMPIIQQQLLF